MQLSDKDLAELYDSRIFLMRKPPVIAWKLKPESKLLFVIHDIEYRSKNLTAFLKKIVETIGLPSELAGFGVIKTQVSEKDFEEFPSEHAIVFDSELNPGKENPCQISGKQIFFACKLKQLETDDVAKRELWEHLKVLKALMKF